MSKRVERDSGVPTEQLLTPFDVFKFGTDEDPCFGKHHDLNADECQICGDVELCSIATMQNRLTMRQLLEKENKYKDLEEAEMIRTRDIKAFIERMRGKGKTDAVIRLKLKNKFKLSYVKAKQYV